MPQPAPPEEVTDDQVEQAIQSNLSASATQEARLQTALPRHGDVVNIDYTGYIDGEAFDGGSAEGADLDSWEAARLSRQQMTMRDLKSRSKGTRPETSSISRYSSRDPYEPESGSCQER